MPVMMKLEIVDYLLKSFQCYSYVNAEDLNTQHVDRNAYVI